MPINCQLDSAYFGILLLFRANIWTAHKKAVILHRISEEGHKALSEIPTQASALTRENRSLKILLL
jgi:hypothetical protein